MLELKESKERGRRRKYRGKKKKIRVGRWGVGGLQYNPAGQHMLNYLILYYNRRERGKDQDLTRK